MTTTAPTEPVSTAAAAQAPPAADSGRDAHGRFAKGNPGGPGNPFARRTAALRQAFLVAVTADDFRAVTHKLIAMARAGDIAAMKLFYQYTVGKPTPAVDPDHLDAEEWQHYKEQAGMMRELPGLIGMPAPDLPLDCMRAARPAVTEQMTRQTAAALSDPEAFNAADEQARQAELRHLERQALRAAAHYADFVPDETGLPPDVRPIPPKANAKNGRQAAPAPAARDSRSAASAAHAERGAPKANGENGPLVPPSGGSGEVAPEGENLESPSANGSNGESAHRRQRRKRADSRSHEPLELADRFAGGLTPDTLE